MPIILCDSLSFPGLERTFKLLPNNKKRPVYPSRHTDTSIWHAWPFSSASETQPIWSFMMTEVNNHKNDIYTHTHTHTHTHTECHLTFRGPCIVIHILIIKANEMHYFSNLFLIKNSCFGQIYCPSLGVSTLFHP